MSLKQMQILDSTETVKQERPAPCARHCEANAFEIVIRGLEGEVAKLKAERKPLTNEEIDTLVIGKDGLPNSHLEFARAIEAAHNIKEKKHDATTE